MPGRSSGAGRVDEERDERRGRRLARFDGGSLGGERVRIGVGALGDRDEREEAQREDLQLTRSRCGGELDRLDERLLALRDVARQEQRDAVRERRERLPGIARRQRVARSGRVVEHLRDARAALQAAEQSEPWVVGAEAAAGRVGPMSSLAGAPAHGVQPRRGNAQIGLAIDDRLVAQEPEPRFERVEPPATAGWDGEQPRELRGVVEVSGRSRVRDRFLNGASFRGVGGDSTVEGARPLRLGSLQLGEQVLADDARVAIAAPVAVDGSDAGPLQRRKHRVGAVSLRGESRSVPA